MGFLKAQRDGRTGDQEQTPQSGKAQKDQPPQPELRKTLLVNPLRNQKPTEALEKSTAQEGSDHSADSKFSSRGFLGGRLHRHSSSPEASLGHDVRAAPGSALARARDELQRARDAETDLENALKRAKQASRDARTKVKDLQSEAVSDLKAAQAKDKEAHSLAKATRGLQH